MSKCNLTSGIQTQYHYGKKCSNILNNFLSFNFNINILNRHGKYCLINPIKFSKIP